MQTNSIARLCIVVFVSLLVSSFVASIVMAESTESQPPQPKVHIVYTERPTDEEPESYHVRTLTSVLGSEDAAKEALIYSYKEAASGFSAKLTPEQVTEISKQPGVLQVVPSQTYRLHAGGGMSLN
ncbi:PREDICTED: subtilisin-like protease SBT3.6 [Tarenaya hassleriana]|uniref:subtilisin-like protease SBT3.6 n=1 Tax=Tarenaya hassleriana TaxID=28532 RepID=UPI00053CAA46|nr:PREDICTED: subtilisin-like protease SBT3.6 [Tarenaya hassleriana]